MDICLCDGTTQQLVSSLAPEIKQTYSEVIAKGNMVVVALGPSGAQLATGLARRLSEGAPNPLPVHQLDVSGKGERFGVMEWDPREKEHLLCDSIVNSGRTMLGARSHLLRLGAAGVRTAALLVRTGANIVPNFYSLEIDRQDAVFFGEGPFPVRGPRVAALRLAEHRDREAALDLAEPYINGQVCDYEYDCKRDPAWRTYVVETADGKLAGLVHMRHSPDGTLFLDTLAISTPYRSRGYAKEVLRFLSEYCRVHRVSRSFMFAVEDKVALYERFGYHRTGRKLDLPYAKFVELESTP